MTAAAWNVSNPVGASVIAPTSAIPGGYSHTTTRAWDADGVAHVRVYGAGIWPCEALQLARREPEPQPPSKRSKSATLERARRNLGQMR